MPNQELNPVTLGVGAGTVSTSIMKAAHESLHQNKRVSVCFPANRDLKSASAAVYSASKNLE
jgi:hypothetical protein